MEFKKVKSIETQDPWYDLTDGGYIKPAKILKSKEDVLKVESAVKTILQFFVDAEEAGVITIAWRKN